MKKVILMLLAVMLVLAACATDTSVPTTAPTTSTPEPTQPSAPPTTPPVTRPQIEAPVVDEVPVTEDSLFDYAQCVDLIGKWSLPVTIESDYWKMEGFTGEGSFPLVWTFTDDGRYTVTVEQESYAAAIVGYETMMAEYMIDCRYKEFVAEKRIGKRTDKEIQQMWDTSEFAKVQTEVHDWLDEMALGDTFAVLARAGYYYVEDGTLYLSLEGDTYESFRFTIDEEGFILSSSSRIRFYNNLCIRFPVVLKPCN